MEASGMEVTVAQNGKEAVDFFAAYGLEATRRIRMLERSGAKKVPVFAMTANAFVEDVNNSLAAGMNANISKPLDMVVLESTMRRLKNT